MSRFGGEPRLLDRFGQIVRKISADRRGTHRGAVTERALSAERVARDVTPILAHADAIEHAMHRRAISAIIAVALREARRQNVLFDSPEAREDRYDG